MRGRIVHKPLFVIAFAVAVSMGAACGGGTGADPDGSAAEEHVNAMEREHSGDRPDPSPAATAEPAGEVESREVQYAQLSGDPTAAVYGYLARPLEGAVANANPAVLLIHEWWGLNDNIRAVANRFAAEGYLALAVDLYEGEVADTRDGAAALMRGTLERAERLRENLRQARDYLIETEGATSVGSVGWCFGGGWSLNAAMALGADLDAAVIYYGRVTADRDSLAAIDAPILGHFGSLDQGIPLDAVRDFETALGELGKPARIHVYEDADHAFANPSGTRYNEPAAQMAWERTLEFFAENLE